MNPPKLIDGFEASDLSPPPMTNDDGGVLPVPPKIEGTSLLEGVESPAPVVAGTPKMGLLGVEGSAADEVAALPKMDPVVEGAPKMGVEDGLGDSEEADGTPNLTAPVPNTGVEDVDDLGVELAPKVNPVDEGVPDPDPKGTFTPRERFINRKFRKKLRRKLLQPLSKVKIFFKEEK